MNPTVPARPPARTSRIVLGLALVLLAPVAVAVGTAPAEAAPASPPKVSVGDRHSCAVDTGGAAWCWGDGQAGRLGTGNVGDSNVAVRVKTSAGGDLTGVQQISAGFGHSCAVDASGGAWCWGRGTSGRLGNNDTANSNVAVRVKTSATDDLTGVQQVSVGEAHSCAVRTDGSAWCWGWNSSGQLGNNSTTDSSVAVRVKTSATDDLTEVEQMSAGRTHSCAVRTDGSAWCWGRGQAGRLGTGNVANSDVAVRVKTSATDDLTGVQQISAGGSHSCAVRTGGSIWCWGDGRNGRLGTGNTANSSFAVPTLDPGAPARQVSAGHVHSCAALADGTAACWGSNPSGVLGDGTAGGERAVPDRVLADGTTPLSQVTQISVSASAAHNCAHVMTGDGTARCWGLNDFGRLGDGTTTTRLNPVPVLTAVGGPPLVLVLGVPSPAPVFVSGTTSDPTTGGTSEPATGPAVSCSPDALMVGTEVTCTVTGGEPGIDILWRAAVNPTIASEGVTLDADGNGTFGFSVPASAAGRVITVELVAWTAPVAIGSGTAVGGTGGPVPSSVPAGEGGVVPGGLITLLGAVALVGAARTVLLGRRTVADR